MSIREIELYLKCSISGPRESPERSQEQVRAETLGEFRTGTGPPVEGNHRGTFQIRGKTSVDDASVRFAGRNGNITGHQTCAGISINGGSAGRNTSPYWVILAFAGVPMAESSAVKVCHAFHQLTCPVPVDSKLERNTLTVSLNMASWLQKQAVRRN